MRRQVGWGGGGGVVRTRTNHTCTLSVPVLAVRSIDLVVY